MTGVEQAQQFVEFGQEVVSGMPAFVDGIGLGAYLHSSDETHLNTVLNDALAHKLSGTSHGGIDVDSTKWAINNQDFVPFIPWLIKSGLWTGSSAIEYPEAGDVDPSPTHAIGLDIPDLSKERVELSAGEDNATTAVIIGALLDGLERRADVASELAHRIGSQISRVVIFSGNRPTEAREGVSGRYKALYEGEDIPVEQIFPTEYDTANAIASNKLKGQLVEVVEDTSHEGEFRNNELARVYRTSKNEGSNIQIIVMNGMPVVQADALNRPSNEGRPRAPLTLEEYLHNFGRSQEVMSYISSYPHRNRIAIEGLIKVIEMGRADRVRIIPQGVMSFPDKVTAGLIAGEIKPLMDLTRRLVTVAGIDSGVIPRTSESVKNYLVNR